VEAVCVVEYPEGNYTGQITPYGERHGWGEMRQECLICVYLFICKILSTKNKHFLVSFNNILAQSGWCFEAEFG